ncbi:MAG: sialate O-acetylesterase [Planctomycetaceae bacterium]
MYLLLAVVALAIQEPDEVRDLYIVAGQSNAVGFDAKPGLLSASEVDAKIPFWWRCGDPPPDRHDTTSRGWTTLKPQSLGNPIKPRKGRQYGNYAQPEGGFGAEIGFARTLFKAGDQNFSIVKAAFSGTGIAKDWAPGSTESNGACYRALLKEVRGATEAGKKEGTKLRLRAILWVQGESDANEKDAPLYAKRLREMMDALRRDLEAPEMLALVAVNTRFGNGNNKFMPTIVKQQQLAAKTDPKCVYVDTSKAPIANSAHYDTKGTILVGEWFAKSLLQHRAK